MSISLSISKQKQNIKGSCNLSGFIHSGLQPIPAEGKIWLFNWRSLLCLLKRWPEDIALACMFAYISFVAGKPHDSVSLHFTSEAGPGSGCFSRTQGLSVCGPFSQVIGVIK